MPRLAAPNVCGPGVGAGVVGRGAIGDGEPPGGLATRSSKANCTGASSASVPTWGRIPIVPASWSPLVESVALTSQSFGSGCAGSHAFMLIIVGFAPITSVRTAIGASLRTSPGTTTSGLRTVSGDPSRLALIATWTFLLSSMRSRLR